MTDQEKIEHHNAIEEIRKKIGGWFGSADKIFAGHPMDEECAKKARKLAFQTNVTLEEIIEISYSYLIKEDVYEELRDENLRKIKKYFGSKLK